MRTAVLVLVTMTMAACGPAQKGPQSATPGAAGDAAVAYDRSRCGAEGQRVVRLTTRDDGKPDIWKFYSAVVENGTKIDVLVCKQVDLNHDGRVDLVALYGSDGRVGKEELDLDFDGKFDESVYYEAGKVIRKEYDRNRDGRVDTWAFFEGGKLVRIERDTRSTGRVDSWEYYESGKLDRIGWDSTGTGRVDRWERAPEEPEEEGAQQNVRPSGAPPAAVKD